MPTGAGNMAGDGRGSPRHLLGRGVLAIHQRWCLPLRGGLATYLRHLVVGVVTSKLGQFQGKTPGRQGDRARREGVCFILASWMPQPLVSCTPVICPVSCHHINDIRGHRSGCSPHRFLKKKSLITLPLFYYLSFYGMEHQIVYFLLCR